MKNSKKKAENILRQVKMEIQPSKLYGLQHKGSTNKETHSDTGRC